MKKILFALVGLIASLSMVATASAQLSLVPLNVGSFSQTKTGPLTIFGKLFVGSGSALSNLNFFGDLTVFGKFVYQDKAKTYGSGKVLTSRADGTAYWGNYSATDTTGACGSSDYRNGGSSDYIAPTAGLCSSGKDGGVSYGDSTGWTWSCTGSTGTPASCMVSKTGGTKGSCGSSKGQYFSTQPSGSSLCATGNASSVILTASVWAWSCGGINGGIMDSSCYANKTTGSVVIGDCGSASGVASAVAPATTNLCSAGTASSVTINGGWVWTCTGSTGTTPASCSAPKVDVSVNGTCGSSSNKILTTTPTTNLCLTGMAGTVSSNTTFGWAWSCIGSNGGSNADCRAYKHIDGMCGGGVGSCVRGAPGSVTTIYCWSSKTYYPSWSCNGAGGGSSATCNSCNGQ